MALQIRHTHTPFARTLDADLFTDYRTCLQTIGLLKRQPKCLRQRKYSQSVKDQGEDASALPFKDNLLESQIPTWSFTLACTSDQLRARTTPQGCRWVRHSSGRALVGYRYPSNHQAANLRFCQSWPWLQQSARTLQLLSSQPLYPYGGIQRLISSANAETFAKRGPANGIPRKAGFVPPSLSLRSKGFKART